MRYVDYVYEILEQETEGMDAVYRDYIEHLVGKCGFEALHYHKYIESCGMVNGRELYTLFANNKNVKPYNYNELYERYSGIFNDKKGE